MISTTRSVLIAVSGVDLPIRIDALFCNRDISVAIYLATYAVAFAYAALLLFVIANIINPLSLCGAVHNVATHKTLVGIAVISHRQRQSSISRPTAARLKLTDEMMRRRVLHTHTHSLVETTFAPLIYDRVALQYHRNMGYILCMRCSRKVIILHVSDCCCE